MSEPQVRTGPQPAAVTFVTTEHFALQSARSSTIAESVGRATMFLAAVSGGLVALGLIATAARVGTAFYAFGLVLLPTLTSVGLVTFERTLESGIEDYGYASRIVRLRAYYLDFAPELAPYLARFTPDERVLGTLRRGGWHWFRTVASMIALITAVLAGSTAALAIAAASPSLVAALPSGIAVGLALLAILMRYQGNAWQQAVQAATAE